MASSSKPPHHLVAHVSGRAYWRRMRALLLGQADSAEPGGSAESDPGGQMPHPAAEEHALFGPLPSRREVLELMGASIALAGIPACSSQPPREAIMPYVDQPAGVTPGLASFYATSMVLDGFATGILVESHEGRPTKIEGNPGHPASLGATGVLEQAAVLELYDPARARAVWNRSIPRSWDVFFADMAARLRGPAGIAPTGDGLWFLLHPQSSPLMAEQMARIQLLYPGARFAFYSPLERRTVYAGASQVFGRALETQYDFSRADVVLSLDADFMANMPFSVRWAHDFAARRRLDSPSDDMGRLYVVEAMPSPTGTLADHRHAVRSSDVPEVALRVLAAVVAAAPGRGAELPAVPETLARVLASLRANGDERWIAAVARDLVMNAGRSIVIAGPGQPAETHALAHLINAALGNLGSTVTMSDPALLSPDGLSLVDLAAAMNAGEVRALIIMEANPVYTAPADIPFGELIQEVPITVHHSLYYNETSAQCEWFLPAAHMLESWGDARSYDGTISFMQPLIEPLYAGRTPAEALAGLAGQPAARGHGLLRELWRDRLPSIPSFEWHWEHVIQRGFIVDSALAEIPISASPDQPGLGILWPETTAWVAEVADRRPAPGLELGFEASPKVYDGRFANNGWLQELPHPLTKLTWDNAAIMAPQTAARLGIGRGDVVELIVAGNRSVRAPALMLEGHAEEQVTLALGYGREGTETLARGVGVSAYRMRMAAHPWATRELRIRPTGDTYPLAVAQLFDGLHDRSLVLQATLDEYRRHPDLGRGSTHGPVRTLPTLLPDYFTEGEQWAMAIDSMICTGCSSCVVACQAENNVPIVGKDGVERGRIMHWLRIERYLVHSGSELGAEDPPAPVLSPEVVNLPMLCQHCEHAPCEYVCPVNATVHSPDGLNEMVYNRCVGTRFCSNNCPYKVRRFNFFDYTEDPLQEGESRTASVTVQSRRSSEKVALQHMQRNPDVTVRSRGVMEKCTFCVQRIRRAEISARIENRSIAPGEIMSACQQACPTRAIRFDSLRHEDTEMAEWRRQPRGYEALQELGTRPRIRYLGKIRNPNPELL